MLPLARWPRACQRGSLSTGVQVAPLGCLCSISGCRKAPAGAGAGGPGQETPLEGYLEPELCLARCARQTPMATNRNLSSNRGSPCQCSGSALQSKCNFCSTGIRVARPEQRNTEILHIYLCAEVKGQNPRLAARDTRAEESRGTPDTHELVRPEDGLVGRELP